ncbi:MAG: hypothetical protein EOP83_02120 [Verrucomicrobiaceae bacterium]|nr:MAG: hypothetical protein EOP83_02120 [Verrucomicrobiaceae bacterium]
MSLIEHPDYWEERHPDHGRTWWPEPPSHWDRVTLKAMGVSFRNWTATNAEMFDATYAWHPSPSGVRVASDNPHFLFHLKMSLG